MGTQKEYPTREKLDSLRNCEAMKKQFALELWLDTRGMRVSPYNTHEVTYCAAERLFRKLWPFANSTVAIARAAVEWANDPIVMQTYLQLENAKGEVVSFIDKSALAIELWETLQCMNPALKETYTSIVSELLAPMLGLDWKGAAAEFGAIEP